MIRTVALVRRPPLMILPPAPPPPPACMGCSGRGGCTRACGAAILSGLRAVRTYYEMPDAETQRQIEAMGDSIQIIARPTYGSTTPPDDYQPAPVYENYQRAALAQYETCDPRDSACVMRNVARMTNAQEAFNRDMAAWYKDPLAIQYGNIPAATPPPPSLPPAVPTSTTPPRPANAVTYAPRLRFENLTTGNASNLKPGDHWRITITGAQPGTKVQVIGGKNGGSAAADMGTTDSAGNFATTGTASAEDAGNWYELWTAGGQKAGEFSFTIAVPPATPPATPPAPPQGTGNQAGQSQPGDKDPADTPPAGFNFNKFTEIMPAWAWAASAGGLLIVPSLLGRGGR